MRPEAAEHEWPAPSLLTVDCQAIGVLLIAQRQARPALCCLDAGPSCHRAVSLHFERVGTRWERVGTLRDLFTKPLRRKVVAPWASVFGNPGSGHMIGESGGRLACASPGHCYSPKQLSWHAALLEVLHRKSWAAKEVGSQPDVRRPSCNPATTTSCNNTLYIFVYKTDVGLEKYLQQIDSFQLRCSLTRFKFGQHWLQCHRGRFQGLPYEAQVCNACVQHVDSEHHAMFDCPKYEVARFDFADLGTLIPCLI